MFKKASLNYGTEGFVLIDESNSIISKVNAGEIDGDIDWTLVEEQANELGYTLYETSTADKFNWIQLVKKIDDLNEFEVWIAVYHNALEGYGLKGYALATNDTTDYFDNDPRNLSEEDLTGGLRLPGYLPGNKPDFIE